jgi:hypothetical protein
MEKYKNEDGKIEMEKYKNEDGKIAVLVSGGFGAGWSTWNDHGDFLAMDKTVVEMKIRGSTEDEVQEYCNGANDDAPYMGGWAGAEIEWVTEGEAFRVTEYDGSESLEIIGEIDGMIA